MNSSPIWEKGITRERPEKSSKVQAWSQFPYLYQSTHIPDFVFCTSLELHIILISKISWILWWKLYPMLWFLLSNLYCLMYLTLYKDFLKIEHYLIYILPFILGPYSLDVSHAKSNSSDTFYVITRQFSWLTFMITVICRLKSNNILWDCIWHPYPFFTFVFYFSSLLNFFWINFYILFHYIFFLFLLESYLLTNKLWIFNIKMFAFNMLSSESSDISSSFWFIKIYLVILHMEISLLHGIPPSLIYKFKHITDFNTVSGNYNICILVSVSSIFFVSFPLVFYYLILSPNMSSNFVLRLGIKYENS